MGIIFSRLTKKKTTIEILDELDKKIKDIENYGQNTEQKHKKIVGLLFIYSGILYVVTAMTFYFYFFPAQLYDQLFYITPLLLFPILILLTKKMISWYYQRKISKNQEMLSTMQQQKKKILDDVAQTETYNIAKEILMKYAPDQLKISSNQKQISTASDTPKSSCQSKSPSQAGTELRRRAITSTFISNLASKMNSTVPIGVTPSQMPLPMSPCQNSKSINVVTPTLKTPLPRPILPQERSYVDKLVDYVVGDGPNNRYALICRQCDSHNGMALKEEFEYFAYRCCYCNFWNPARKQKPSAPKLDSTNSYVTPQRLVLQPQSNSLENLLQVNTCDCDIVKPSDTDCDIDGGVERSKILQSEEKTVIDTTETTVIRSSELTKRFE